MAFAGRLCLAADDLHIEAAKKGRQKSKYLQREQEKLHEATLRLGDSSAPVQRDSGGVRRTGSFLQLKRGASY